ncbi:hypothetical protein BKA70DRAFT_1229862 [Coprinopsis sp. MPI-PUGE-AT-0042]|nr:hypothetical protein BKA70DRAFT_1229862 [Coprinopsis sp. MPI-PUGE-AT-0042]
MRRDSKEDMLEQLQRDMGLQDDPSRFEAFQFRWDRSKSAQQQDPKVVSRFAWKVQDCLPFFHHYAGSNWPILFFLEIQLMSLQRKEAQFRQRSDSQATLPDFPLVEIGEVVGSAASAALTAAITDKSPRSIALLTAIDLAQGDGAASLLEASNWKPVSDSLLESKRQGRVCELAQTWDVIATRLAVLDRCEPE